MQSPLWVGLESGLVQTSGVGSPVKEAGGPATTSIWPAALTRKMVLELAWEEVPLPKLPPCPAVPVSWRQAATSHSSVCEDNRDAAEPYRPRSALHSEQSQLNTWAENG